MTKMVRKKRFTHIFNIYSHLTERRAVSGFEPVDVTIRSSWIGG